LDTSSNLAFSWTWTQSKQSPNINNVF
jgi:hypothetical protein